MYKGAINLQTPFYWAASFVFVFMIGGLSGLVLGALATNIYVHDLSLIHIFTRYLNGMYFLPFEWKMAIVEASKGISGPTLNKVLRFCFTYDPVGQGYVLNITKLGGIAILFFATVLLLFLIFKPRKIKNTTTDVYKRQVLQHASKD